jgi:hypothetical protein
MPPGLTTCHVYRVLREMAIIRSVSMRPTRSASLAKHRRASVSQWLSWSCPRWCLATPSGSPRSAAASITSAHRWGAWLVLALAAPAASGERVATDVLTHLHAAVPRRRPGRSRACPGLDGWRVGLPATVANGPAARPGPDLARPDDRAASSCRAARPPPTDQLGPSAGFDLQVGTRWLNFRAGIAILGAWRSGGSTARST